VFLDWAFRHDFERNGPSLFRICETTFQGWKRYHNDPDLRVRRRFAAEARKLRTTYNAALWAMEKRLSATNPTISKRIRELRREVESAFGTFTRMVRVVVGPILLWTSKREDKRLANGITYEPETFVERRNWIADKLRHTADVITMHPRHSEQPLTNIAAARVAVDSLSQVTSGD
jgi:peptidoglycan/xylan/chitin deacetylase (PgdA/CDA1 family)